MIALGTDDDGVTSYEVSGPTLGECPFCADRGPKFVSNPMMDETGADLWAVMCPACGATSPPRAGRACRGCGPLQHARPPAGGELMLARVEKLFRGTV